MRLSEKEFAKIMSNKSLSVQVMSKKNNLSDTKEQSKAKDPKYKNRKVFVYDNGLTSEDVSSYGEFKIVAVFDSVKEYHRSRELQIMEKNGKISSLERQVPMMIQHEFYYNDKKIAPIIYMADFRYIDQNGKTVVEDVKPYDEKTGKYRLTKDFRIKWKLLEAKYPDILFEIY